MDEGARNKEPRASLSRRSFLKRTAAASVAAAAFPAIVPARALGLNGATPPSERLAMGCIGVGSMGTGNMKGFLPYRDVRVAAVCDVDREHREEARRVVNATYENEDCAAYNDFRELLEREDLDCVSIALPDHWHAIPVIAAARKGLDIYAEKPLALTIDEGRAMVEAVERNAIIWQTGSWQRSQSNFRRGCELVRNGYIGEVTRVEVGLPTGHTIAPQEEMPVPEGFDYDMWLGPAPWAPYTKERCHWNFRWILDYSGGQLTDWAAHHCDIANWGMGTEYTGPVAIEEAVGDFPGEGLWDAAVDYSFHAVYAPGASPVAPRGFVMAVSNGFRMGARFIGSEGEIFVSRGDTFETTPESLKEHALGPNDVRLYESPGHARNFFDCIRSREETVTPIEPAQRAITIAHLGNIAMLLDRDLAWDPVRERVLNDPEADGMRRRAMRGEWRV